MGRNPSGSAGTGQAKMGSRARRGRGGSQAPRQLGAQAPRRRRRRPRRQGRCSHAQARFRAPGSLSSAVYVWTSTPQAEIIGAALPPPEAFTTWQSGLQSGEPRAKRRGGRLPGPSSTLYPGLPPLMQWICTSRGRFPWCISVCRRPPCKLHLSSGDILWKMIGFLYGAGSAGAELEAPILTLQIDHRAICHLQD